MTRNCLAALLVALPLAAPAPEYMEKESRYGDRFVEMRKDMFQNGSYPGSALITVTNFARPGIEIEIQAVGVVGERCSTENPCSAEGQAR